MDVSESLGDDLHLYGCVILLLSLSLEQCLYVLDLVEVSPLVGSDGVGVGGSGYDLPQI